MRTDALKAAPVPVLQVYQDLFSNSLLQRAAIGGHLYFILSLPLRCRPGYIKKLRLNDKPVKNSSLRFLHCEVQDDKGIDNVSGRTKVGRGFILVLTLVPVPSSGSVVSWGWGVGRDEVGGMDDSVQVTGKGEYCVFIVTNESKRLLVIVLHLQPY